MLTIFNKQGLIMSLTVLQKTTLSAHIRANTDPQVSLALQSGDIGIIADIYNTAIDFQIWRNSIDASEYRSQMVWTEVDTMGSGNARIWSWLTRDMRDPINAADSNIRAGIADAWAANTVTRSNLLSIAYAAASLIESIFATGIGTINNPATATIYGPIDFRVFADALRENP